MVGPPRLLRRPDVEITPHPGPELGATDHRSRLLQDRLLADPGDQPAALEMIGSYESMASTWSQWAAQFPDYASPVRAGLAYARERHRAVELCCGTGQGTEVLVDAGYTVAALDSSRAMLAGLPAPPRASRILADVRGLPLADGSCPLLVGLNAVLFPAEIRRVLRADGQLLWCFSFGAGTPLYLDPERALDHLGADWSCQYGRAGRGEWILAERPVGNADEPLDGFADGPLDESADGLLDGTEPV